MLIAAILSLSLVFLASVLVTGWDMASALYSWQARIKIGQWSDREQWRKAVEKKARKWLERTPTVPITDNRRYILLDMLKGRYRSRNLQAWQTAGLILGLSEEDAATFRESRPQALFGGTISVDEALLAYSLKKRNSLSKSEEDRVLSFFKEKLSSGTLPYSDKLPDYRYVDTIGMITPLLYSSGMDAAADRQIDEYDAALYDGVFPHHALDLSSGLSLGAHDWGRGVGWYILGLVESGKHEDRVIRLAERMFPLQRQDGSFGCFFMDRYSRKDSSATVLAGLLFASAYEISKDVRFVSAARAAEKALMTMTRRDGVVDFAQGDTKGVGMYSSRFEPMPFVQGMTLYLSKRLDIVAIL